MIIAIDFQFAGYTPGQTINVKVNVNNESNQVLSSMEVQLCKVNNFFFL